MRLNAQITEELIDAVVDQVKNDADVDDYTVIYSLLETLALDENNLEFMINALPEEQQGYFYRCTKEK